VQISQSQARLLLQRGACRFKKLTGNSPHKRLTLGQYLPDIPKQLRPAQVCAEQDSSQIVQRWQQRGIAALLVRYAGHKAAEHLHRL
jgi:hypothetical protein